MKELLTYIVQNLVDHPDEVVVTERKAVYSGETVYFSYVPFSQPIFSVTVLLASVLPNLSVITQRYFVPLFDAEISGRKFAVL